MRDVVGASRRWTGTASHEPSREEAWRYYEPPGENHKDRPSENFSVLEFEGSGVDEAEVGKGTGSYVRKVQVWLRCTRLPPEQRALALSIR